jgi:hypothetical protein
MWDTKEIYILQVIVCPYTSMFWFTQRYEHYVVFLPLKIATIACFIQEEPSGG